MARVSRDTAAKTDFVLPSQPIAVEPPARQWLHFSKHFTAAIQFCSVG